MRVIRLMVFLVGFLASLPSQQHCGLGRATFPAPPALNSACAQHDAAYAQIPGIGKYFPGMGGREVQRADAQLIRDAVKAMPQAPVRSAIVATYFAIKTIEDRSAHARREMLLRLEQRR